MTQCSKNGLQLSFPKLLIVSEEKLQLEAYKRMFHPYVEIDLACSYEDGLRLATSAISYAVVLACCDLLGPKDRELLRLASKQASRPTLIALVDSSAQCYLQCGTINIIQHEFMSGSRHLLELLLMALTERRLAYFGQECELLIQRRQPMEGMGTHLAVSVVPEQLIL